jgi:RNA polymerase sigma-70 factor (ECF subfamily)
MQNRGEKGESHIRRDIMIGAFIASLPAIRKQVKRMINHPEDAEDVVQEVMYKALRGANNFRGESQINTWLYRVTRNTALDKLDLAHRKNEELQPHDYLDAIPHYPSPEDSIIEGEAAEELLSPLSEVQKKTIILRAHEYPYEEIADILNEPVGTVKSHKHRGEKAINKKRKAA